MRQLSIPCHNTQFTNVPNHRQICTWGDHDRRIDAQMLTEMSWSAAKSPLAFVCGPTPLLVEVVATSLVSLGHDPGRVKTERFAATGG